MNIITYIAAAMLVAVPIHDSINTPVEKHTVTECIKRQHDAAMILQKIGSNIEEEHWDTEIYNRVKVRRNDSLQKVRMMYCKRK